MPLKTRLRVTDVYSDSDNESIIEKSLPTSHQASKSPAESDMDEDGENRVQFLTTIDGKRFTEIGNDISEVHFEDIIEKLEAPEKWTDGNNMFFEFSANIDVFEKK
ncbi:hypothetical protein TNIN_79521 [Trichonephila inaurata madagascariensis]|uniref:Uncharacterized protein n=1 Tax=Trichonephila inaurata madagascariensis TaxID=2747483 RepID=A0A8X6XZ94_9ARAC|nr:hypothetical protein TNIN_79521 [Trichonephila inaurata madagascariensis]